MASELNKNVVLVVDDDKDFTEAACLALKASLPDVTLIKSFDGNDAIERFEEYLPAVIVLDLMLPKRSGFLVMEKVFKSHGQSIGRGTKLPIIIIVTANQGARHKMYAESLGILKYLNKPFRMEKLCQCVQEALELVESSPRPAPKSTPKPTPKSTLARASPYSAPARSSARIGLSARVGRM